MDGCQRTDTAVLQHALMMGVGKNRCPFCFADTKVTSLTSPNRFKANMPVTLRALTLGVGLSCHPTSL